MNTWRLLSQQFPADPIAVPGVTWARGRVPTPHGFIEAEWKLEDGKPAIRVKAPASAEQT